MTSIGIRELRDRLSHYLREVARTGEPITVTDHGRPIAELVPVVEAPKSRIQELIDAGLARPPLGRAGNRSVARHQPATRHRAAAD
jgi:prevent-host-death family protein